MISIEEAESDPSTSELKNTSTYVHPHSINMIKYKNNDNIFSIKIEAIVLNIGNPRSKEA